MAFLSELDWPAFLLAMVLIELTPGPNMGWLAMLSAQHGWRVGLMAVAGITIGLGLQVLAAATGVAAMVAAFPVVFETLRWAGVAFMLWLAWQAYAEMGSAVPAAGLTEKGFRRGLIANLLNPKALLFYVVVIGQFTAPESGAVWQQILILGTIHLLIAGAVHIAIVSLGTRIGQSLERWRRSQPARLFFAVSLVAIAIWIGVSTV
ncbi:MAG: LysE family translocator [Hyphomonadaceae bacterium]|nr:LysE family translocator [Hyphomonadaceae bacterium]